MEKTQRVFMEYGLFKDFEKTLALIVVVTGHWLEFFLADLKECSAPHMSSIFLATLCQNSPLLDQKEICFAAPHPVEGVRLQVMVLKRTTRSYLLKGQTQTRYDSWQPSLMQLGETLMLKSRDSDTVCVAF